MKICILGASGMLGHALFYELSAREGFDVYGTVRDAAQIAPLLPEQLRARLIGGVDACNFSTITKVLDSIKPDIVINCIGMIPQSNDHKNNLVYIDLNARLPQLLHQLCKIRKIRLIHYSTDCIFDGKKGEPYTEEDLPTAQNTYGFCKYLGEVHEAPSLTIRTSIIGHELRGKGSLLEWFLSQKGEIYGYTNTIFTGLPTVEHARVLAEFIVPNPKLCGLYHLGAHPISKYALLTLIATNYDKKISITPDGSLEKDMRLSCAKFTHATGYTPRPWTDLVSDLYKRAHLYDY